MHGPDGAVRPHWQVLDRALRAFGPGEMWRRWEQARQLIRQHGVTFNVYGDARGLERPWPLDPVPVVLAPDEFAGLAAGLAQRATLLDRLLADLYGPRRVIARRAGAGRGGAGAPGPAARRAPGSRHPADASCISTPPIWCARPRASCACWPIGRRRRPARATRWRTASCSGAFCPRRSGSARRSGWRCSSGRCARRWPALAPHGRENPRIVLLTAGPLNATYFEQAFLAQYLGYPLVEGGDLTVRDGRVFLKTLGGLHPVDVILRRLQRRLLRSARAAAGVAARRPRAGAGGPRRQRRHRQRARQRRRADAGVDPVPARRSVARCWARS